MPDIARFGKQGVRQCTLCHLPDGSGRPENAPISAYHPTYFMQQMQDFRDGLRKSADPRKANTNVMIGFAKATTREEDLAAAQYFAQQQPAPHQGGRGKTAPKVRLQGGCTWAFRQARAARWCQSTPTRSSRFRTTTCGPRPATPACPGRLTCRQAR
jgi:cytochrome c553